MKIVVLVILGAIALSQAEPLPTVDDELQSDPQRWAPIKAWIEDWRRKNRPRDQEDFNDQLMMEGATEDNEVYDVLEALAESDEELQADPQKKAGRPIKAWIKGLIKTIRPSDTMLIRNWIKKFRPSDKTPIKDWINKIRPSDKTPIKNWINGWRRKNRPREQEDFFSDQLIAERVANENGVADASEALAQADDELQADPQRWAPIKAWIKGWRRKNRPRELEDVNDQLMAQRAAEDKEVDDALEALTQADDELQADPQRWAPIKAWIKGWRRKNRPRELESFKDQRAADDNEVADALEALAAVDELQADPQRWAPIKAWIKGWRRKNRPRELEDSNDQLMAQRAAEDNEVADALEALAQADDELQADPQRWAPIKAWIKGWRRKNRPRELEDFNDQQMTERAADNKGIDDAVSPDEVVAQGDELQADPSRWRPRIPAGPIRIWLKNKKNKGQQQREEGTLDARAV